MSHWNYTHQAASDPVVEVIGVKTYKSLEQLLNTCNLGRVHAGVSMAAVAILLGSVGHMLLVRTKGYNDLSHRSLPERTPYPR